MVDLGMITPTEEWHLDTRHIGRRVLVFDRVHSTNTEAAARAGDSTHAGVVYLAHEQTAGRGQHGRSWLCQPGTGVLLSVLLFPPPALRRPVQLAAWAANSVCDTIFQCSGLRATIKWPNDVLIQGRKVCGILIEQGRGTVVGIGLNVNQTSEALALASLSQAASLRCFTGNSYDCSHVACALIEQLDIQYDGLLRGDHCNLEAAWTSRTGLVGKRVLIECHDGTHFGRLKSLSFDGARLELARDENCNIRPESIKHVTLAESPPQGE